jgi:hypothetical protein
MALQAWHVQRGHVDKHHQSLHVARVYVPACSCLQARQLQWAEAWPLMLRRCRTFPPRLTRASWAQRSGAAPRHPAPGALLSLRSLPLPLLVAAGGHLSHRLRLQQLIHGLRQLPLLPPQQLRAHGALRLRPRLMVAGAHLQPQRPQRPQRLQQATHGALQLQLHPLVARRGSSEYCGSL